MAMANVLTDDDLLHNLCCCVKDPDPDVQTRTLLCCCAINHAFRNACEAYRQKAWGVLLWDHFEPWMNVNAGELALAMAKADLHPRAYLESLLRTTREFRTPYVWRGFPTRRAVPAARNIFIKAHLEQWRRERDAWRHQMGQSVEFPSLFVWANPKWRHLPDWERVLYHACHNLACVQMLASRAAQEEGNRLQPPPLVRGDPPSASSSEESE
jgi:hypothetical protein